MRFVPGGPDIPDKLLAARDVGEVLFFCGAGVSRAKAGLPDFVTLARHVADDLGSMQHGEVRRLLDAAGSTTTGGKPVATVAMDRVFTLLQQEFEVSDVRRAVAMALQAPADCDLSPHRTLLELSRVRTGQSRVVTTNFDRLFELAQEGLYSSAPPHLPDPRRPKDFHGVVHLHGAVNRHHNGAEHDEFVLSSGEFGHAYLSDGWATRYIQALLERFIIVFVGYSADDPPVQYLLEAMNRGATEDPRLYAFHLGSAQDGAAQWSNRGVSPVPFDQYSSLWDTLEAWATRAKDIDAWHRTIFELAKDGPAVLTPHERSLVTHLARSTDGARVLATSAFSLPAEWLFVFDRAVRYSTPSRWREDEDSVDPFDALGLDEDPAPDRVDTKDPWSRRKVPPEAWDAFDIAADDRDATSDSAFARLTGASASAAGRLPARLRYLGLWIARQAHQPAVVAWMAGRGALHSDFRRAITLRLRQKNSDFSDDVREAWARLMISETIDTGSARHVIGAEVEQTGWSTRLIHSAAAIYRPHVVVRQGTAMPWFQKTEVSMTSLMRAEVEYPQPYAPFKFPDGQLALICRIFRAHLELAVQLESELKESSSLFFDAIRPLPGEQRSDYRLNGLIGTFTDLVTSLAVVNPPAAKREVAAWSDYADAVFTHLRVWASGYAALMTPASAASTLLGVSAEVFWSSEHERDLLLAIRDRWKRWSKDQRFRIEERILKEPLPWFTERDDRDDVVAFYRLNRLQWLKEQGATFSFDELAIMAQLRVLSPSWEEDAAKHTAQPRTTRLRAVSETKDETLFDGVPLDDVVAASDHLAGYDFGSGTVRNPFSSLARQRPARALRALVYADRRGVDTASAWATFLNRQIQGAPSGRMLTQVARRLSRLPVAATLAIAHPIADWMTAYRKSLAENAPADFEALWKHVLAALKAEVPDVRSGRLEWLNEAINRPAGKLTELMFKDSCLDGAHRESGLPPDWIDRIKALLALPAPQSFYALAVVSLRFTWLSWTDPKWTEDHLLPWATDEGWGGQAFWSGFLSGARTPNASFYMRIKSSLLRRATNGAEGKSYRRIVAGMLLIGWRGIDSDSLSDQQVSDAELREVLILGNDELRREILWHLGYWTKSDDEESGWEPLILPFLRRVWPLQRAVKTAESAASLMNLAFAVPEALFDDVVTTIEGRLTVVETGTIMSLLDEDALGVFVTNHAQALLTLLWGVLSEDATRWPYGADACLDLLGAEPLIAGDARLIELQRRRHQTGGL